MSRAAKEQPILVKRYARSRLFDTQSQSYVSVEHFKRSGETFPSRLSRNTHRCANNSPTNFAGPEKLDDLL